MPLPTTSMVSRDTSSCSWPEASICASSVMAGTCRNSRSASNRRCSSVPSDHGSCVVQPSWLSISLMNSSILSAAASACSCWILISEDFVLLNRKTRPRKRHWRPAPARPRATNSATYLMNSRLRSDRRAGRRSCAGEPIRRSAASDAGLMVHVSFHPIILAEISSPLWGEGQLVPPPHSITSSASARNVGGTFKFIALAVFMLSTNRYRVGSSNGRSAGLAPWKMRATSAAARSNDFSGPRRRTSGRHRGP